MTTPPDSAPREPALPTRLKQVSRAWGLLLVALSIITLGLRGYLLQRLHDGVLTVWQVIWLTLPLVAATTILVYRWRTRQPTSFAGFVGVVLGTLAASVLTGISSGQRVADSLFHYDANCLLHDTCTDASNTGTVSLLVRVFSSYLQIYGATGVLSAIAVGTFMGYAFAVLAGQDRGTRPVGPPAA